MHRHYKRPYTHIAERILGRPLPIDAIVHHVDEDRTNNSPSNLVILENRAEHAALHQRLRVLQAGGRPYLDQICCTCSHIKPKEEFVPSRTSYTGRRSECKRCVANRALRARNRRRGWSPLRRETPRERLVRNTEMANRRWGNYVA